MNAANDHDDDVHHKDDASVTSFIRYMMNRGNLDGLRRYADLMYAGLVKNPMPRSKQNQALLDLMPHATKCRKCKEPIMDQGNIPIDERCRECETQYEALVAMTRANLELYRDDVFYAPGSDYVVGRRKGGCGA